MKYPRETARALILEAVDRIDVYDDGWRFDDDLNVEYSQQVADEIGNLRKMVRALLESDRASQS